MNEITTLSVAIKNKSKRSFAYRDKELKKQASYFSPAYRDFIYKVISNGSLNIKHKYENGYTDSLEDGEVYTKLSRRQKNQIVTDINDVDVLPHELGHAVDFWFGKSNALTRTVIISNNQTLYEIFTEEFKNKEEELYELVMEEYKNIINSNINDKAFDILTSNIDSYRMLTAIKVNLRDKEVTKVRREIQNQLYKSGFVEAYYQLFDKKCYLILNTKYSPILDALSSTHDFKGLCLSSHSKEYYKFDRYRVVQEFFANSFAAKVTSQHVCFDNLMKYLPKSFDAFERLFVIFYDHITNNKKFTDLQIIKGGMRNGIQSIHQQKDSDT